MENAVNESIICTTHNCKGYSLLGIVYFGWEPFDLKVKGTTHIDFILINRPDETYIIDYLIWNLCCCY